MGIQSEADSKTKLEEKIKAEAMRLGFSLCGITGVDPPEGYDRYEFWLKSGFQAGMNYLSSDRHRQLRKRPTELYSEAQSIICLGWSTPLRISGKENNLDLAWVAGYAGFVDYHDALPRKMEALVKFIQKNSTEKVTAQIYTDNAPILERELAVRAGLGWIGKNSCFISPKQGSSILLAEIFINMTLTPDPPFTEDRCGSCRRCIESCPTGCILPDRTIDSSRCISYLTVENKGTISESLRDRIGNWFFGCDQCQMVCPWNQKSAPHEGVQNWSTQDLIDLLFLPAARFSALFKKTAYSRAKRFGLQRNALVWLGNHTNTGVTLEVIQDFVVQCTDPALKEIAQWVIKQHKIK